jgi:hypothetical protein
MKPNQVYTNVVHADQLCLSIASPPERCHRRIVAERLARTWPDVEIVHLG